MIKKTILTLAALFSSFTIAGGRTQISTAALRGDQITVIKTAQGITTRISFPDAVKEIICGDLYDPASGRGAFVVQRGDNDIFLKPVTSTGTSNLFVRTGQNSEHIYSFDLSIVAANQACRIFNVVAARDDKSARVYQSPEAAKIISEAERQAEEIVRAADKRVELMLSEAKERSSATLRKLLDRADREVDQRFIRAYMTGMREIKVGGSRIATKGITIALDTWAVPLDGKLYLRYMIQNLSNSDFVFQQLLLESTSGDKAIQMQIAQSKSENSLRPREALVGVITIEQNAVSIKDGLALCVRGEDNAEIARVNVSE